MEASPAPIVGALPQLAEPAIRDAFDALKVLLRPKSASRGQTDRRRVAALAQTRVAHGECARL
jgi:hypothetical protein